MKATINTNNKTQSVQYPALFLLLDKHDTGYVVLVRQMNAFTGIVLKTIGATKQTVGDLIDNNIFKTFIRVEPLEDSLILENTYD